MKQGDRGVALPQLARAHICSCSYTSIQCLVADRLRMIRVNSGQHPLDERTEDDSGIFIPTTFGDP